MNIKEQYKILEFGEYGDERGNLVVAKGSGKDIPFEQSGENLHIKKYVLLALRSRFAPSLWSGSTTSTILNSRLRSG